MTATAGGDRQEPRRGGRRSPVSSLLTVLVLGLSLVRIALMSLWLVLALLGEKVQHDVRARNYFFHLVPESFDLRTAVAVAAAGWRLAEKRPKIDWKLLQVGCVD